MDNLLNNVGIFIGGIGALIGAISGILVIVINRKNSISDKERDEKLWKELQGHQVFSALIKMSHGDIEESKIKDKNKREMVAESLRERANSWLGILREFVDKKGECSGIDILDSSGVFAEWIYSKIEKVLVDQVKIGIPQIYLKKINLEFKLNVAGNTHDSCQWVFDNKVAYSTRAQRANGLLGSLYTSIATVYYLSIISANEMNGELEVELKKWSKQK